jgi:hypothetical protein
VTSIDRFSIRPWPLSISHACSISASRRALWRGGKAGLRLGECRHDVLAKCRLILFHGQDVIASSIDHFRANIAVREHSVSCDNFALERQYPQEFQRGLVFVGLGIHPELGQDRFDIRGKGGHEMHSGRAAVATPPGGLTVDGDMGASPDPRRPWIHWLTRASKSTTSIRRKTRE